jgi:hypothetical protein
MIKVGDKVTVTVAAGVDSGMGVPSALWNVRGKTLTVKHVISDLLYLNEVAGGWFFHRFTPVLGVYGTGKGTTAKILQFIKDAGRPVTVKDIAAGTGLPSRQLSKRLREQELRCTVQASVDGKLLSYTHTGL